MQANNSPNERKLFHEEYLALATRFNAASSVQEAHSVMLAIESLFRCRGQIGLGPLNFNSEMGVILARRSELCTYLGDTTSASALMNEALKFLRGCPIAIDAALLTPRAVLKLVRDLDARSGAKWRQS